MTYKITLSSSIEALGAFMLQSILIIGFIILSATTHETQGVFILYIGFFIIAIPTLYLHLEYYYINKGTSLEISPEEKKLYWTNKSGATEIISFADIEKIVVTIATPGKLPFTSYNYAKIYTKLKEEIIITSLMTPKIENTMRTITDVNIERRVKVLPIISIGK